MHPSRAFLGPNWQTSRGRLGGLAARDTYARRRTEIGDRYATKGDAYAAGYRRGYMTAMVWWRRRSRRSEKVA